MVFIPYLRCIPREEMIAPCSIRGVATTPCADEIIPSPSIAPVLVHLKIHSDNALTISKTSTKSSHGAERISGLMCDAFTPHRFLKKSLFATLDVVPNKINNVFFVANSQ